MIFYKPSFKKSDMMEYLKLKLASIQYHLIKQPGIDASVDAISGKSLSSNCFSIASMFHQIEPVNGCHWIVIDQLSQPSTRIHTERHLPEWMW